MKYSSVKVSVPAVSSIVFIVVIVIHINDRLPFLLQLDLERLSTIILDRLFEPWMLKSFLRSDASLGVVDKDFPEKIDELFIEC